MLVEEEVHHQLLEASVLHFNQPQPAELAHAEMRVLLLPGVDGLRGDAELSAQIADRGALSACRMYRRSALRSISTASSIHSFRKGPPKLSAYSRVHLLPFSGETSHSWKLMPLTLGSMTVLWCGHVYKFSHRFRSCELCEWPVREAARHSAQSRLSGLDSAAQLYSQALRPVPHAIPSCVYEMWALFAPVSAKPA